MLLNRYLSIVALLTIWLCVAVKLCQAQEKVHLAVLYKDVRPYTAPKQSKAKDRSHLTEESPHSHHGRQRIVNIAHAKANKPPYHLAGWDITRTEEKSRKMVSNILLVTHTHLIMNLAEDEKRYPNMTTKEARVNAADRWAVLPTPVFIETTILPNMSPGMNFTYTLVHIFGEKKQFGLYEIEESWRYHELFKIFFKKTKFEVDFLKPEKCYFLGYTNKVYSDHDRAFDLERARLFPNSTTDNALIYGDTEIDISCKGIGENCTAFPKENAELCQPWVDEGALVVCKRPYEEYKINFLTQQPYNQFLWKHHDGECWKKEWRIYAPAAAWDWINIRGILQGQLIVIEYFPINEAYNFDLV